MIVFLTPPDSNAKLHDPTKLCLPAAIGQNDLELTNINHGRFSRVMAKLALTPFIHPTLLLEPDKSYRRHDLEQRLASLDSDAFYGEIESLTAGK